MSKLLQYLPIIRFITGFDDVKLTGGISKNEGVVEVLYRDIWRSICIDTWDQIAADIVCRQLGYTEVEKIITDSRFGHRNQSLNISNTTCSRQESSLNHCHGFIRDEITCYFGQPAGVVCANGKIYV